MIEQKLKLVHLQLTYKCNLHCYFCGQWGEHGYLKNQKIIDLTFDDWKNIINQLIDINSDKTLPEIIIWGGEPFLYPDIKKILKYIKKIPTFRYSFYICGIIFIEVILWRKLQELVECF